MKIGAIVTLATVFIFILCTGTAMAAGEQNTSTLDKNTSLNFQSNKVSSFDAVRSETLNISGYWINPGSTSVNCINVTKLNEEGVTDLFISTSKSNPTSLQGFITKFNNSGIRVHAWVTCFHDGNGWTDPGNQTLIAEITSSIFNIATNYTVHGIHLDAVRYPEKAYLHNGTTHITSFVENIYNEIQRINSEQGKDILLSAALMPECGENGYHYGQDYGQLAPYLDFMVPMIYKGNYEASRSWIISTTKYIINASGGKPVVAGLQTYMSDKYAIPIPSSELDADIQAALDNGSAGYVLFRYGLTDEFDEIPYSYTNLNETLDAAAWVKNYIKQNRALPSTISVNTVNGTEEVDMPILLSLLARGLVYINKNDTGLIGLIDYGNPTSPSTTVFMETLTKAEYMGVVTRVSNFMNAYGRAPNYAGINSDRIYYQCLIEIFSELLDDYRVNGALPLNITLDTTPPLVTGTNPVHNATKISLTAPVIITFNKNIEAGSNYSGIYIKNTISGVKVAITQTINGDTLTIQQTTSKLYYTPYQVYIPAGAINSITGTSFDEVYTYYFTTLSTPDTTPPTVTSIDPTNNAVNVPSNKVIEVTFSENIKGGSYWIELLNSSGKAVNISKSVSGKVLTIKPTSNLAESKYKLVLHTGSVTDLAGNPQALKSYVFSVVVPPTVTKTNPVSNAVKISRTTAIIITFSENIKAGTKYSGIYLKNTVSGVKVAISKTISGNTLTIKQTTTRLYNTLYQVYIPAGAVKDAAGNNLAKVYTYYFTTVTQSTDTTPPKVTKTSPTNNAINFSRTAAITVTFSENIKAGTKYSGIYIKNLSTGKIVSITKSISSKTLTIKMVSGRLSKNTYQIYIPAEAVKDGAGNSLASVYILKFKTV